ncbi:MAG: hypothetical protein O7A69_14190 [SAR324 cluster bacterium]|nr:hypothetical protein [SAR324 cluster bacterium]
MNPIWAVLLVAVAFVVVLRIKRRRRLPQIPVYARRIEGFQVVASLAPEMSSACLFDHGVQYGKGFRRKEGPELPHDERCRCASLPFSFTSNEVFNGALRNFAGVRNNEVQGFTQEAADDLVAQLKKVESVQLPVDIEAYLAAVQVEESGEAMHAFLSARYTYLTEQKPAERQARLEAKMAAEH